MMGIPKFRRSLPRNPTWRFLTLQRLRALSRTVAITGIFKEEALGRVRPEGLERQSHGRPIVVDHTIGAVLIVEADLTRVGGAVVAARAVHAAAVALKQRARREHDGHEAAAERHLARSSLVAMKWTRKSPEPAVNVAAAPWASDIGLSELSNVHAFVWSTGRSSPCGRYFFELKVVS